MYQNEFITSIIQVQLKAQQPISASDWSQIVKQLMQNYVTRISSDEKRIIGHIKCFSELSETSFIKASCIDANLGIHIDQKLNNENTSNITLLLNALVANLNEEENNNIFLSSLGDAKFINNMPFAITYDIIQHTHSHDEHSDDEICLVCGMHHDHDIHHIQRD